MDLFQAMPNITEEKLHPKFKMLRDSLPYEQNILTEWSNGFIDRDRKFALEFQRTFHSSFFELYLHNLFTKNGFSIDYSHNRPDFILKKTSELYVEAVVANIKKDGRPENARTEDDLFSMFSSPWGNLNFIPEMEESIIRYSSAITGKVKKYKEDYKKLEWVNPNTPFVIAMASYDQVNYGREYVYPMMALLYGAYFDPSQKTYYPRKYIIKPETNVTIDIGLFLRPEYNCISAIIYTSTLTLGKLTALAISRGYPSLNKVFALREKDRARYLLQKVSPECPELLSDGVFIFFNPNAENPMDEHILPETTKFFFEDDDIKILGIETPLMSRINIPACYPEIEIMEAVRKYNEKSILDFYEI